MYEALSTRASVLPGRSARVSALLLAVALVIGLTPPPVAAAEESGDRSSMEKTDDVATRDAASGEQFDEVAQAARDEGMVRAIVGLATAFVPEGELSREQAEAQRGAIAAERSAVHDDLAGTDYEEVRTFETVPYVAMLLSEEAVERLRGSRHVTDVVLDEAVPPALADSVPLVQASQMQAEGFGGEGFTVAILDTGVESDHPFFSGRVTEEACYSSNAANSTTLCPDGSEEQVGEGAGEDCDTSISGCGHGTHVAGIAAGDDGVAPDAEIMAIQVFSRFDPEVCGEGESPPCALSFVSDQIKALERVHELHTDGTHTFVSANMSLGGGQHFDACDGDVRKAIIDNLRSVDVATVISSGNAGFTDSVGAPACISTAVSVGSTTKGDALSGFSNMHPSLVDVLAPGSSIRSSVPGGGFAHFSGTSMAAPHVAGAWAVLRQHAAEVGDGPDGPASAASVSSILDALQSTGLMIADTREDGTAVRPRIRVADAAGFEPQPRAELDEGFEAVPPIGWDRVNLSEPLGTTGWMQGSPGTFPAHAGPTNSYAAANFNSTSGTGTISNWLITPLLELDPDATLSFYTRSVDSAFPDRLEVRVSTDGSCAVSGSASDVGDFTTLLLTINPDLEQGGYPGSWTQYEVPLDDVDAASVGCIAFRYHVTDGGPSGSNSDYIGIDTLTYAVADAADHGAIDGTVTDAGTGAPIEGATVSVTGPAAATATTGPDGSYLVDELPAGSYTVTATAGDYGSDSTDATVEAGETTTVDFSLTPLPGAIVGTVTGDDTEAPIDGASVEVTGPVSRSTTTDAGGEYDVDDLPPGAYTVTVSADGYGPASDAVNVVAGTTATADFELEALPGEIAGVVTGSDTEAPVAGASVSVDGPVSASTSTGPDGTYEIGDLPAGSYTVTVSADEYESATEDVVVERDATTDVPIVLEGLPGALSGVVTDGETATPVAGASVSVEGPASASTTTGADGTYELDGLPPGAYTLTITADGYEDLEQSVDVPRDATEVVDVGLERAPAVVESTGEEATAGTPLVTSVSSPMGGPVTIDVVDPTVDLPEGWVFAGDQVSVSAPDATVGNPLVLTFRLHASRLAAGQSAESVALLRDGDVVVDCDGPEGVAQPDPCVESRELAGAEVVITVLASQASVWNLLRPEEACPPGLPLPFDDVSPSAVHAPSIACAVHRGVARGVTESEYRPSADVRRGQMATFVAQALEAAGFELPEATDQGFTDVSGVHADAINRLVAAGVVGGTSATTFNPSGFVRRAQMASFIVGAVRWATGEELEAEDGPHFTDTENNPHEENIDLAFELGLTAGAGEGLFAPGATVRRAPMASFLVNLLDVLWPEPTLS